MWSDDEGPEADSLMFVPLTIVLALRDNEEDVGKRGCVIWPCARGINRSAEACERLVRSLQHP